MSLRIQSRDAWGAEPPNWTWDLNLPVHFVFLAYTNSDHCYLVNICTREVRYLQNYYKRNGTCPDIRYNFLIGGDGTVYEGRGWDAQPGLPPKYCMLNTHSLYVGFLGTFKDRTPKDTMFSALDELIIHGVQNNLIKAKFLMVNTRPAGIERGLLWY